MAMMNTDVMIRDGSEVNYIKLIAHYLLILLSLKHQKEKWFMEEEELCPIFLFLMIL